MEEEEVLPYHRDLKGRCTQRRRWLACACPDELILELGPGNTAAICGCCGGRILQDPRGSSTRRRTKGDAYLPEDPQDPRE